MGSYTAGAIVSDIKALLRDFVEFRQIETFSVIVLCYSHRQNNRDRLEEIQEKSVGFVRQLLVTEAHIISK